MNLKKLLIFFIEIRNYVAVPRLYRCRDFSEVFGMHVFCEHEKRNMKK